MKRLSLAAAILLLSTAMTGCGQGQFANPFAVTLNVTMTPAQLELTPGQTKSTTVTVKEDASTITGYTLNVDAPTGLKVDRNGPVLTVSALPDTPPGLYPAIVTASVTGGSGSGVLNVNVTPAPTKTYTATLTPSTLTMKPGQSRVISVAFTQDPGYTGTPVVIGIENGERLDAKMVAGNSIQLTATNTPPGTYVVTVITSDGTKTTRLNLTVTVEAGA